jgi:hypothetical protein
VCVCVCVSMPQVGHCAAETKVFSEVENKILYKVSILPVLSFVAKFKADIYLKCTYEFC